MKIEIKSWEDSDYLTHQHMYIDDDLMHGVHPLSECPEDAIVGRDLTSCGEIVELMRLAYEAGKNGEEFSIENIELEEADW